MKRTLASLALALPIGIALTGTTSCSATPKGSLVLAISTDMQTPKDVDLVSVFITTDSVVKFDYLGRVLPSGTVSLPATLAIVEPDDPNAKIRIRVIGFQGANARVLRDVNTTVPHAQTTLLRLPHNLLDDGSAMGMLMPNEIPDTPGGPPEGDNQSFDPDVIGSPTCPFASGETSVNGVCVKDVVDSVSLPAYDPAQVYGAGGVQPDGTPTDCFDTSQCFGAAVPVSGVDMSTCSVPLAAMLGSTPDAGADSGAIDVAQDSGSSTGGGFGSFDGGALPDAGAQYVLRPLGVPTDSTADASSTTGTPTVATSMLNFALATQSTGACVGGKCFVPLEYDQKEGWTVQGSTVQMIPGICSQLKRGAQLYMTSGACQSKILSNPVCQPASHGTVGTGATDDASLPMADASVRAGGDSGTSTGGTSSGGGGSDSGSSCIPMSVAPPPSGSTLDCIWQTCASAIATCETSCSCAPSLMTAENAFMKTGMNPTVQILDSFATQVGTSSGGAALGSCIMAAAPTCVGGAQDASASPDAGVGGLPDGG
jgi:hypothetical protein